MDDKQKQKVKRVMDGLMKEGMKCLIDDYGLSLHQAQDWCLKTLNSFDKELDKWIKEEEKQ